MGRALGMMSWELRSSRRVRVVALLSQHLWVGVGFVAWCTAYLQCGSEVHALQQSSVVAAYTCA